MNKLITTLLLVLALATPVQADPDISNAIDYIAMRCIAVERVERQIVKNSRPAENQHGKENLDFIDLSAKQELFYWYSFYTNYKNILPREVTRLTDDDYNLIYAGWNANTFTYDQLSALSGRCMNIRISWSISIDLWKDEGADT